MAWAADEGELKVIAELLTEDVTLEARVSGLAPEPGRAAVPAFFETAMAGRAASGERGHHLVTTVCVDMADGDVAFARSYVTFVSQEPTGPLPSTRQRVSEDRLVAPDGGGGSRRAESRSTVTA